MDFQFKVYESIWKRGESNDSSRFLLWRHLWLTCASAMNSVEWQAYGKTHFFWRGRLRYRLEISCGSGGQAAADGLRNLSGFARAPGPQLQALAGGSKND